MRFLLSSFFLLLVSCAPYPKKQGFSASALSKETLVNPFFSDATKDYVYKSKITIYDKTLGGILIIKKTAEEQHRIVFTTEMGNTIFDFTLTEEQFKVNRILADLDRKIIVKTLQRDFTALIKENLMATKGFTNGTTTIRQAKLLGKFHYYTFENGKLVQITRTGNTREKVVFRFSGINDNIAQEIQIDHRNIRLQIGLKAF